MRMKRTVSILSALGLVLVTSGAARAATIDFEGLTEGAIVSSVMGNGISVGVDGFNPSFGEATNAAMVFDSSCAGGCSGDDPDLGSPNQTCPAPGPGVGAGGEFMQANENCNSLGNVLIISEDLDMNDPDDADQIGARFDFDFSACGSATITSMDILDIEAEEPNATVDLFDGAMGLLAHFEIGPLGDNGYATADLGPTSGVVTMVVTMNGSGAIDNIVFDCDDECGNNEQEEGEECDGTDNSACNDYPCRSDCICGFCGDGILDEGERCDDGNNENGDGCDAECNVEVAEGCTPGYWKTRQHLDSWMGVAPGDNFNDTFMTNAFFIAENCSRPDNTPSDDPTLLKALWCKGGATHALARHATAALLNSLNPGVDYGLTDAEVKALVKAAIDSGDLTQVLAAKNDLADRNEAGCPLN